jgi:hypothetical protein
MWEDTFGGLKIRVLVVVLARGWPRRIGLFACCRSSRWMSFEAIRAKKQDVKERRDMWEADVTVSAGIDSERGENETRSEE